MPSLTGKLTRYHLNSNVQGRGVCIQMDSSFPTESNGWACLWKDNPLYEEITDLLLNAYLEEKQVTVQWEINFESYAKISLAESIVYPESGSAESLPGF